MDFALVHVVWGLWFRIPLCCIVNYVVDRLRDLPPWSHRLCEFSIGYGVELPDPEDMFLATSHVPCRACMKRLLAIEYGL